MKEKSVTERAVELISEKDPSHVIGTTPMHFDIADKIGSETTSRLLNEGIIIVSVMSHSESDMLPNTNHGMRIWVREIEMVEREVTETIREFKMK